MFRITELLIPTQLKIQNIFDQIRLMYYIQTGQTSPVITFVYMCMYKGHVNVMVGGKWIYHLKVLVY